MASLSPINPRRDRDFDGRSSATGSSSSSLFEGISYGQEASLRGRSFSLRSLNRPDVQAVAAGKLGLSRAERLKTYHQKLIEEDKKISQVAQKNIPQSNFGIAPASIWVVRGVTSFSTDVTEAIAASQGQDGPKALKAFSVMSVISCVSATIRLKENIDLLKRSLSSKDRIGLASALMGISVAILQYGSNGPTIPIEILKSILASIGTSLPAVLTKIRGVMQGVFGASISLLLGIMSSWKLLLEGRFILDYIKAYKGKTGTDRLAAKLKFLLGHFELTLIEKEALFRNVSKEHQTILDIENQGILTPISSDMESTLSRMLHADTQNSDHKFCKAHRAAFETLYLKKYEEALAKKARSASRVLGDEALYQLKQELLKVPEERLLTRLNAGDETAIAEAEKLLTKTLLGVSIETFVRALSVVACLLGVVSSIGGIFLTGGTGLILMIAISALSSASWIGADGISLLMALRHEDPGRYEKIVLAITSALLILVSTVGFFLTSGLGSIALMVTISAIWLAIMAIAWTASYYKARKARERADYSAPTTTSSAPAPEENSYAEVKRRLNVAQFFPKEPATA